MSWRDFFQKDVPLYVNERHKLLHHRKIVNDYRELLIQLGVDQDCVVLDYGCGEALSAGELSKNCRKLWLYDPSTYVQSRLQELYSKNEHIRILTQDDLDHIPEKSVDVIIITSVMQYLTPQDHEQVLNKAHRLLKPSGYLILADLIPQDTSAITDTKALLRFAWEGGFFIPALIGLVRTYFSDYRHLRTRFGLSTFTHSQIIDLLKNAGFEANRHAHNVGHNQNRMTYVARVTQQDQQPQHQAQENPPA